MNNNTVFSYCCWDKTHVFSDTCDSKIHLILNKKNFNQIKNKFYIHTYIHTSVFVCVCMITVLLNKNYVQISLINIVFLYVQFKSKRPIKQFEIRKEILTGFI